MLSYDLVEWVARSPVPFTMAYAEDTSIGSWFDGLQISNIDDARFHHLGPDAPERWAEVGCRPDDIMTHYMTSKDWDKCDHHYNITGWS